MFYPVELLSHRRRGKLAPCWLAATSSEKLFKRYYKSNAIKKINVVETCKEILQVIQSPISKSRRFSLYLLSQLMSGITKIHSYQIAYYQKEAFEMQRKLDSTELLNEKGDGFDAIVNLELPAIELPLTDHNFLNTQLEKDLHLLPDEDFDGRLQIAMQDAACLNFGCLNDEELEFILERDGNISLFACDLMKNLKISKEKDISEKMADITITEEIQEKQLSQEILSPVLTDVLKRNKSEERLSLTPQKRQSHKIQVETPTKRRRLSFETVPPVPVEDVIEAVSVPELPVEETRKLIPSQQMETDMELQPLHSSYFVIDRRSKKNKIIDRNIALNDKQFGKWRQNTNIHCRKLDRPLTHHLSLTPAKNLFKQPSHLPIRWNTSLRNLFVDRTTGPFVSVDEDVAPAELMQFPEIMHVEDAIRPKFPMEDLSTFGKTDTAIADEPVDSVVNTLPGTNIIHETASASMVPLSEVDMATLEGTRIVGPRPQERTNISNTDESFEDIDILLKKQRRSLETKPIPVPSISSTSFSQPALTSQEILALLEVLWRDKEIVKFNELIPKDTYTREDAATAFEILLELYAENKVVLQQIDCSHTLRILKYKD